VNEPQPTILSFKSQILFFHQTVVRYALRHKVATATNILSLSLGIAVYLAVQVANTSANRAFRAGIELVAGKSHLEVRGSGRSLDENVFPKIAGHPSVSAATAVVEGYATLSDHPGSFLHILGVDIFTNTPFQIWHPDAAPDPLDGTGTDLEPFLSRADTIAIGRGMANALDLRTGDALRVQADGVETSLVIGYILDQEGEGTTTGPGNTVLMDIGWAQELFQCAGSLSSVQVILHDPTSQKTAARELSPLLPHDARVAAPEQRGQQVELMLRGFQLNLRALSMVSVLVGVFLIFSTTSASVVRRRKEIGTLRALGASRAQVASLFLVEALVSGLAGVILGIPSGIVLAGTLAGEVARTISVHYILVSVGGLSIELGDILFASGYGITAALAGAWLPAREAAYTDPARALQPGELFPGARLRTLPMLAAGCFFLGLSTAFCLWSLGSGPAWLSFIACLFLVIAFSLTVPAVSLTLSHFLATLSSWTGRFPGSASSILRIAGDNFSRSLHRTSLTIAALAVALSMTAGVSAMITSFRDTVSKWAERSIVADLFIGVSSNQVLGTEAFLPDGIRPFIAGLPGVDSVDSYRELETAMPDGINYSLAVIGGGDRGNISFVAGGDKRKALTFFEGGNHVVVSESFADKFSLEENDTIPLQTPSGEIPFTVAGVFYDYSDDHGRIYMTGKIFSKYWGGDTRHHSLAIYLSPDTNINKISETIKAAFSQKNELILFSNRDIRQRVFEIFDQTFAITHVLRSISLVIAATGIVLALTTLVSERVREIAVFRSLGGSRGQIALTYLTEGGMIGLASGVVGTAGGLLLAVILTWVVNKAFFGWTVNFQIPWGGVLLAPVWVTVTAVLASLFPALRASRLPVAPSLRTG